MAKIKLNIDKSFFNDVYIPLLNCPERFLVIYGGAGSGKSQFCVQKHILKALMYPNRKILVVRKVLATIRESIFALFLDQLSRMKILEHCNYTTSHMKIEFPNGSELVFAGLEDPERIKSITNISDIIIEEATELNSSEEFEALNLRLRSNQPNQQITLLFNPVSKNNWTYSYFFEQQRPNTRIVKTNYTHNRFLPEDFIQSLLAYKETNPLFFSIYAMGDYGNLDELIFNNYRVERVEDKGDLLIGLDLGFSTDPSSCLAVRLEGSNLYVVGEVYRKGMFTEDIVREVKRRGWDRYSIAVDSAEPRTIADLKRQGLKVYPVKKGKDSINHGISWLQSLNSIIIDPKCENLIREMSDYTWLKDKDGTYIQKVNPKCSDHAIDSLRYATEIIRLNNKVRFMNKGMLGL